MSTFKKMFMFVAVLTLLTNSTFANAYANTVTYSGQGLTADGFGGYDLNTELCGVENGAEIDGPYLLFILTAASAQNADIKFGNSPAVGMTKFGNGTFKYVSEWIDPGTIVGLPVIASYDGRARNAQLVISHGCRPLRDVGGWCSPGFWRNARDGAWALTPYEKTDLFNVTVNPIWYGATFAANPTLLTVLNTPQIYSGPPVAGTSGYALNAFNATGAMLTDSIDGVSFDWDVMVAGGSDACPIDSFGNFKNATP